VKGVTGIKADKKKLKEMSANISNIVRRFNIREGLKREDDRLPKRLHREALKGGHRISEAELEKMVSDYYRLRGWDEQGNPETPDILEGDDSLRGTRT
jgi:aldehyde:ferredoxin oxidoreductase